MSESTQAAALPGASSCAKGRCALAQAASAGASELSWRMRTVSDRLQVIRDARHLLATRTDSVCAAISPSLQRTAADTLVTELLPLLDAMRFLERRAARLLSPCSYGRKGRPAWLFGVSAQLQREPLGHVLVIGPANFPLFLPGVQVMQALTAGNCVTWKPGTGGEAIAQLVASALRESGLPPDTLRVTGESIEFAQQALAGGPDKVVFTGSATAGKEILHTLADQATPSIMELSGADAVLVLPSADLNAVAQAVAFGLRLNGGEVCMSPRRLLATAETLRALRPLLQGALAKVPPIPLKPRTAAVLQQHVNDALAGGAVLLPLTPGADAEQKSDILHSHTRPILLDRVTPAAAITRSDLFAPVLSLIEASSPLHLATLANDNPFGLTAAIFGAPSEAEALAAELRVGTVLINDLIAPTADPRVPFGGRGASGFGLTRGAEGLLSMTHTKVILRRKRPEIRHYAPVGAREQPFIAGLIGMLHGGSLRGRLCGLQRLFTAARTSG